MSESTSKSETTRLDNIITYNILSALGKEADFLYDTIDTYYKRCSKCQ